jgi:hypothetical protein
MKPIKWITVHPELDNTVRQEVKYWCEKTFHSSDNDYPEWYMTSNYDRTYNGTFDMRFKHLKYAEWFILRWGGNIVEIEYEDVPEQYFVREDIFKTLFE